MDKDKEFKEKVRKADAVILGVVVSIYVSIITTLVVLKLLGVI